MNKPPWDRIIGALETWRTGLGAPSVTTVAEHWERNPWAVLVSTIISLRTKDAVTLGASERLLARAPTPESLLRLSQEEIEKLLFPAGFYRTKAGTLRKIAEILLARYGGAVPADMDALLALPGAGRKTANLVLIEAFDKEGLCVDTHVHRISNRTGWVDTAQPDDTEARLREVLPRQYWKAINPLLVLYGQRVCKPVGPRCGECVIARFCAQRPVSR